MKTMRTLLALLACSLLGRAGEVPATATTNTYAGHWEGSIALPGTELAVRVDLERRADGKPGGTIDIPTQGLRGFKLVVTAAEGADVSFAMPGIPGDPKFAGKLDGSTGTLSGQFSQGGQVFPFTLERKPRGALDGETPAQGVPGTGLAGIWQGSLKATPIIELRLLLEVTNTPAGKPDGVLVSLDQGQARIPITVLTESADGVHLEARGVGGVFDGRLSRDGAELEGTWQQAGQQAPLVFKRLAKAPTLTRPQEPRKPYAYDEEQVVVENPVGKVRLAGTLTLPRGAPPHPAVVLITGSGPEDRDEAVMGHRPFLVLADHLTRHGIVVLRCDDRGVGQSTGDFAKATDTDFVEDTLACVAYLRTRKEVRAQRIGLVGHSEGGIIAPLAAVKSQDVAFIVLLAGVGVPMEELLVRQGEDISRVMGLGAEAIAANAATQREVFRVLKEEPDPAAAEKKLRELLRQEMAKLTEEQRKALGLSDALIEGQIRAVLTPWFRQLLVYDPRPTLRSVKCPVLALNGGKDLQVAAKENLGGIRDALAAGGNRHVKTMELPGLNHLFQSCRTGAVAEYSQIEETFSPSALKLVSDWILDVAHP